MLAHVAELRNIPRKHVRVLTASHKWQALCACLHYKKLTSPCQFTKTGYLRSSRTRTPLTLKGVASDALSFTPRTRKDIERSDLKAVSCLITGIAVAHSSFGRKFSPKIFLDSESPNASSTDRMSTPAHHRCYSHCIEQSWPHVLADTGYTLFVHSLLRTLVSLQCCVSVKAP